MVVKRTPKSLQEEGVDMVERSFTDTPSYLETWICV